MNAARKTLPWQVGHNGATQYSRHEAQRMARELVEDPIYKDTLQSKMRAGKLPPMVECMLWDRAYGKVIEEVNVTVSPGAEDLSTLSVDELLERAQKLQDTLKEAKAVEEALPAVVTKGPW